MMPVKSQSVIFTDINFEVAELSSKDACNEKALFLSLAQDHTDRLKQ